METEWNTGRPYQRDGQRIKAKLLEDGSVVFADMSRLVDGHMGLDIRKLIKSPEALQRYVMSCYDKSMYTSTMDSWKYLMLKSQG
jgi:hypothetical protein